MLTRPLFLFLDATAPRFMPPRASEVAGDVDGIFEFIFWVSAFFFAIIVVLTIVFAIRYRQTRYRPIATSSTTHSTRLELLWSSIPLVLVLVMFGASTRVWLSMTEPAGFQEATRIHATGRVWSWSFEHPGGKVSGELHLVTGHLFELVLSSPDVLHSLWIPAFRVKQDVVPGRYTKLRIRPTQPGTYPIFCAEFCGTNHSLMRSSVVVHPDRADYDRWVRGEGEANMPLPDLGRRIYETRGCSGCHSIDGSPRNGPTFKGLWGRRRLLADGTSVIADEDYVRESILEPRRKLVSGFPPTLMPPTVLSERELAGVIEFIRSLEHAR